MIGLKCVQQLMAVFLIVSSLWKALALLLECWALLTQIKILLEKIKTVCENKVDRIKLYAIINTN